MCNTGLILKIQQQEKAKGAIAEALDEKMINNHDGFSFVEVDNALNFSRTRTMDENEAKLKNRSNEPFLFYHFRLASSGSVTLDNTHFWRRGQFYFAHNGGIQGYEQVQDYQKKQKDEVWSDAVDSQIFFYQLTNRIKEVGNTRPATIAKAVKALNDRVWGRYQLLDSKKKRAYFVNDWFTYIVDNAYLVITSAKMDFNIRQQFRGLPFVKINSSIKEGLIDGIWLLNLRQGRFKQLVTRDELGFYGYDSYYNKGYYNKKLGKKKKATFKRYY